MDKMKIYLECVLVLTLDFYIITSSDLPKVPDTVVIKPPPAATPATSKPSVTIYYDAMEENSQLFFNTTLVEKFLRFGSYVDMSFIPCQKVEEKNGDLSCDSKVDPLCMLNKIHSCAMSQVTNRTQLVSFLACTMSTVRMLPDFVTCAIQNGINDQTLQTCASTDAGKTLCKNYNAQKMPATDTMPGFVLKNPNDIENNDNFGHFDEYINNVCVTDFESALCAELETSKATSKPEECNKKLVLGIFYKAMDSTSQKWFQNFTDVYKKYSNCLTIKYQPCMLAELSDGVLNCADENDTDCVAAKTHACAVSIVNDASLLSQFMSCAMKESTKLPDFDKCAKDSKVEYDPIKKCADSDTGKNLCFAYSKTRPDSDKIPAFSYELTFDKKISEDTSTSADLKSIISEQMKKYNIKC